MSGTSTWAALNEWKVHTMPNAMNNLNANLIAVSVILRPLSNSSYLPFDWNHSIVFNDNRMDVFANQIVSDR